MVLVHFWSSAGKLVSNFYRNVIMLIAEMTSRAVLFKKSWVLSTCSHLCVSSESAHSWNSSAKRCEQILTEQKFETGDHFMSTVVLLSTQDERSYLW